LAAAAAVASGAGAAGAPPAGAAIGAGVGGLALGFALGAVAFRRRGGAAAKPLASAPPASAGDAPAAAAGVALAATVNPLARAGASAAHGEPPRGERWVRVFEDGLECCEREDGTGDRVWPEDLPPGAVLVG